MKDVNTGAGQKRSQGSIDHPFTTNGGSDADLNSRYTEHYGPQGPHGYKDGPGYSQEDAQRYARFEPNKKIKIESSLQGADNNTSNNLQYENRNVEKTHSQQTRTIFRHSGKFFKGFRKDIRIVYKNLKKARYLVCLVVCIH